MKNMVKIFIALGIFFLGVAISNAYSEEIGKLTFKVKVSDLGLQTGWIKKGKTRADEIRVTLPGKLYSEPLEVLPIPRNKADLRNPIDAQISDFSAFKKEDKAWIKDNFVPEEHGGLEEFFDDTERWDKNRKLMRGKTKLLIYGYSYYKDYAFVFCRFNDANQMAYTTVFKKTRDGWQRTNSLASDETFDIVWSAFRENQVFATGK